MIFSSTAGMGHTLFPFRLPPGGVGGLLRIEPGEGRLLAWVTAIQVVMSASSILVNNVAQTTFLKRFGADALPLVFMIEALITLGVTGLVGVLMTRFPKIRVFTGLLVFYGAAMGLVRLMIPFGVDLVYPVLYILKSQAVGVLPILYWDILSDLFTTRQSKRLYTLISAGGILGIMAGSLMTRQLAIWVGIDNILILFVAGMALAALLNEGTEKVIGRPLEPGRKGGANKKADTGLAGLGREFLTRARTSALLRYMVLLIAIPNMILPILDFQFNVMVDDHFASEANTLGFFGMFRGISNGLMFAALLFSSRLIAKWGIPVCLLFHPINYAAAFGLIFLRFDILAAVYARISTEMLKTVINNPARAVLYNFFPEAQRTMIRLVLRGGVVRISDFAGSGLLVLIASLIDPRMLSLVALPLALVWVGTSIRLKQTYVALLMESLTAGRIDWAAISEDQRRLIARDRRSMAALAKGLGDPDPEIALLSAQIISRSRPECLVPELERSLPAHPPQVQIRLLGTITREAAAPHVSLLETMAEAADPDMCIKWLETLNRVAPGKTPALMVGHLAHPDPGIRLQALIGLMRSPNPHWTRLAAAAQGLASLPNLLCRVSSDSPRETIRTILACLAAGGTDPRLRAAALTALGLIHPPALIALADQTSKDPDPGVREAALAVLADEAEEALLKQVICFLGDPNPAIRATAVDRLLEKGRMAIPALLSAMAGSSGQIRDQAALILGRMGLPQAALSGFIQEGVSSACTCLIQARKIQWAQGPAAGLLVKCLEEQCQDRIRSLLRVLGSIIFKDQRQVIYRGAQSGSRAEMDMVIEILEARLHPGLSAALIPLLEDRPWPDRLDRWAEATGKRLEPPAGTGEGLAGLMTWTRDPVVLALCLCAAGEEMAGKDLTALVAPYQTDPEPGVALAAAWAASQAGSSPPRTSPLAADTWCLRNQALLAPVPTAALTDLARQCRSFEATASQTLLKAGQGPGPVYVCCSPSPTLLTEMHGQEKFPLPHLLMAGEMPWIDRSPQPFSVRVEAHCRILEIPGRSLLELLTQYPLFAMGVCREYNRQIRAIHSRISQLG